MRKISILICLIASVVVVRAQDAKSFYKNRVSVAGELTSEYTWQLDFSYHYMLSSYLGIGASAGMWRQFSVEGVPEGEGWRIADEYKEIGNIYLRPSLLIISPALMKFSDSELKLFMEPGFMMNIPYCMVHIYMLNPFGIKAYEKKVSTNKGKWYAFDCKTGFSLNLENLSFSLGYQISTLDVYSMRRELVYDNKRFDEFYPKKKTLHGGFLSISVFF